MKIAVLVSGGGTNLQAIIDSLSAGKITNTTLELVVSNKPGAYALERAAKNGIPSECVIPKDYSTREEYGEAMISLWKNMRLSWWCWQDFWLSCRKILYLIMPDG